MLKHESNCPASCIKRLEDSYERTIAKIQARGEQETVGDDEEWSSGEDEVKSVERHIKVEGDGGRSDATDGDLVQETDFEYVESDRTFDAEVHAMMPAVVGLELLTMIVD